MKTVRASRVATVVIGVIVGYAGIVWVYARGVADGSRRNGAAYAANAAHLLLAVRAGRADSLIPILEDMIDSGVMLEADREEWFMSGVGRRLMVKYGVPDGEPSRRVALRQVMSYRKRHPLTGRDKPVGERTMQQLEQLEKSRP